MERSFPQYSRCAAPGDAYSMSAVGGWLALALLSFAFGTAAGGAWAIVSLIIAEAVSWGCIIGIGLIATAVAGVHAFKYWYYNERLMCIDEDRCVVGTMTGDATVSTDGDRKFDVLVAPFSTEEVQVYFAETIQANPAEFGPGPANFNDVIAVQNYVEAMTEATRVRLYMRVTHERMFSQPGHAYQKHFLIRELGEMGAPAFDEAPDDELTAAAPNPMFRIAPADSLAPYMHNELEGNRLERWLENILVGLWTFLVSYTALCAICEFYTGGADWFCGWAAAGLAALLALLAWLISHLVNDPDDGVTGETDVDVDDPAYEEDTTTIVQGDLLALHGDWIMDTEHEQYFELHPIKAIYLVCESERNPDRWDVVRDLSTDPRRERCPFPVEKIDRRDWARICAEIMADAETTPVENRVTISTEDALSMAAGIR